MIKSAVFLCFLFAINAQAQNTKPAADKLGVPGALTFQKKAYDLAWTSHPSATYYKQEYVPKGDTVERFKTMLLLEALTGNVKPADAAASKLAELKRLKASNPAVEYESFNYPKAGEYLIHFVFTAAGPDGRLAVAEQNVYCYKAFTDSKGKTGLLLFGVSKRGYGAGVPGFLAGIKTGKATLVNEVAQTPLPQLTVAD